MNQWEIQQQNVWLMVFCQIKKEAAENTIALDE